MLLIKKKWSMLLFFSFWYLFLNMSWKKFKQEVLFIGKVLEIYTGRQYI